MKCIHTILNPAGKPIWTRPNLDSRDGKHVNSSPTDHPQNFSDVSRYKKRNKVTCKPLFANSNVLTANFQAKAFPYFTDFARRSVK